MNDEKIIIAVPRGRIIEECKDFLNRTDFSPDPLLFDENSRKLKFGSNKEGIEYIKVRYHEDGISISQIARELNICGVPTKRGGKWSHKQVSRILNRT